MFSSERAPASREELDAKAELDHVAVLHDVLFAFDAGCALGVGFGDRPGFDEVAETDDLGLDEALFEVSVNKAGSLRSFAPFRVDRLVH